MMSLAVEYEPSDISCTFTHFRVRVHSKPLNLVYNPSTVARVKQFLSSPIGSQWREELTTQTSNGLRSKLGDMFQGDNNEVSLISQSFFFWGGGGGGEGGVD